VVPGTKKDGTATAAPPRHLHAAFTQHPAGHELRRLGAPQDQRGAVYTPLHHDAPGFCPERLDVEEGL
jgi:hypothetical protein